MSSNFYLPEPGEDDDLREFILEFQRTDGRMDEDNEQKIKARRSVRQRIKMNQLAQTRYLKHIGQADLASKAGISRRTLSAIENGRNAPSVFVALALAEVLDTKVEDLFYIRPPAPPPSNFTRNEAVVMSKDRY